MGYYRTMQGNEGFLPVRSNMNKSWTERLKGNRDTGIIAFLFLLSFALHIVTAARTVTFSDAGDFLMAIKTVGNCHSPGYPLYLMTAKLFTFVFPFGPLPFRVSVYSGLMATLTCCLLYWVVLRIFHSRLGGVVCALAFCFSYTFWYETLIPETYALDAFLTILLIAIILRWERLIREGLTSSADNTLALFAFCYGLALANRFSVLFLLPAFALFAIDTDWRQVLAPRNMARMAVFFALGLLPYLYEPAAAFRGPAYNFGDPSTIKLWFQHMTFFNLRGGLFQYPLQRLPGRFLRFFAYLNTEFPYFAWLGYLGLLASFLKRAKKYVLFLLLLFLLALLPILTYRQIESVLRAHFYYPAYLIFSIWIGAGASLIAGLVGRLYRRVDRLVATVATLTAALVLLAFPAGSALVHYGKVDKSSYTYARDMAKRMLEETEESGIILVKADNVVIPCLYMQVVEGIGTRVTVLHPGITRIPGFDNLGTTTYLPEGFIDSAGEGYLSRQTPEKKERVPLYTTDPTFASRKWEPVFLGYLIGLYPKEGPVGQTKETDLSEIAWRGTAWEGIDSDAREAVLLPEAFKANVDVWSGKYRAASRRYRNMTECFQRDMYVPTLYSCGSMSSIYDIWGQVLNRMGEFEATTRYIPRAKRINPDFFSLSLAIAYKEVGKLDLALEEVNTLLSFNSEDFDALAEKGKILIRQKIYNDALKALGKAALFKDDPEVEFLGGLATTRLGMKSDAERWFKAAMNHDPDGRWGKLAKKELERLQR